MLKVPQLLSINIVAVIVVVLSLSTHLSFGLFELCDETFRLDSDENVTIASVTTLTAKNVSSCRMTVIAPANYIVKVTCALQFDQLDSASCPTKRFFISLDGVMGLHHAHNFCNKNGTARIVKRRSVMNRLVMAYVSKRDLEDEKFTCIASRVKRDCDCGWSKRVSLKLQSRQSNNKKFIFVGTNLQWRECNDARVSIDDRTCCSIHK